MHVVLILLILAAIVALVLLGVKLLQLRRHSTELKATLEDLEAKHANGMRQWHECSTALDTERKRSSDLSKHDAQLVVELRNLRAKYDQDVKKLRDYSSALRTEYQRLSRYKGVADADAKVAELLLTGQASIDKANADARSIVTEAKSQAKTVMDEAKVILDSATVQAGAIIESANTRIDKANAEAGSIVTEGKNQAKTVKDEAKVILDSATVQAGKIIESANTRAEEIAGSAYDAMKNAALYEQTVKAMKNIIEGYGDKYIVPSYSLLDDLAEEFGYDQAGQELKTARERTKYMIRNSTAATCDYVEATRRDTAISFVIDAFNGKVDSILSRVRHNNAGTLQQEIHDAFALVNFNAKAFREARITEEFLVARLDELKWAAIVQELRIRDLEEQRRLKEQKREEEKVRRERERAVREAAKEAEIECKAQERIAQEREKVTQEMQDRIEQAKIEGNPEKEARLKAQYEQKLQEKDQQLQESDQRRKEAEERGQRAISRAQQTKDGHVYVISNIGSFGEHVYKIGLTRRDDRDERIRELGDSSVPFAFDVHAWIHSKDAPTLETKLHRHFLLMQMNKVNHRKEFFRVDLKHIREEVEKMGLGVQWTMTAQATEYRESQKIEKMIEDNPAEKEKWLRRQIEMEIAETSEREDSQPTNDESINAIGQEGGA